MANPYSIGRDCDVILLWNGTRVDLRDVTGFQASQETRTQRADPLNSLPVEFMTPSGWRGSFTVARANATLDSLVAAIESAFWNANTIGSGTIYQYVKETDGSTSTWEYSQASFSVTNGAWAAEGIVQQTINFFASTKTKIS